MNNLEKAKEVIKEHYEEADCGIFNTRNWAGGYIGTRNHYCNPTHWMQLPNPPDKEN